MAQATLPTLDLTRTTEATALPGTEVRVDVHDASRLEWAVSIPLPESENLPFTIELTVEIPSNMFVQHSPWEQLQQYVRLDGPEDSFIGAATIDGLRRGAVAVANRMSRASEGFGRHCRAQASPFEVRSNVDHLAAMHTWLENASGVLDDARQRLVLSREGDAAEVRRERALVDEFLSGRFLEMLGGAERALTAAQIESDELQGSMGKLLLREMEHRKERAFVGSDLRTEQALERYLDRASQLKKHFQEVLFLEAEQYGVAERMHHVVAALVAVFASTWAFVWQVYLASGSTSSRVSSSFIFLAVVAGLIYAVKDRIKEVGRSWVANNVHRIYAQRISRYRAPKKTYPGREVVVRTRESFERHDLSRPDPLNPESGARVPYTILRYSQRGVVAPQPNLAKAGVTRVKHVFRYDLTPLFARLDDATKPVPVYDEEARRVRFLDAPRCYRLPLTLHVSVRERQVHEEATLVMHKRGLDRIET